jgi:DNA-binding CsgD family transcriptional regulator
VACAQRDWPLAAQRLEESLALFRELGSPLGTAEALQDLGRAVCAQGDIARGAALYAESLVLLKELGGHQNIVARSLEGLAGVAGSLRLPEHAARLFGAADRLREISAIPRPPAGRADYERDLAAARARMDRASWAAAWAAGRALTPEQAIAETGWLARAAAVKRPGAPDLQPERAGQPRLTPRERQVIALLARGYSNRQIGEELVITERTAEIHVGNILGKLGLSSRAQAAAYAVAQGLADRQG